jgi:RNA polymerase sigma-70 factor (ECF subfamily)
MIAPAHDREPMARSRGIVLPLAFTGDDAALVEGLRNQHPGAKAAFFHRHAEYVERVITRVIGFDPELSDILQQAFLNALTSLRTLKDPSALRPWLAQVAALTARKVLRTRSRRRFLRLFVDQEDERRAERPAVSADAATLHALWAVYAVLEELPADEHIAFALRFVEGMELTEVAAACRVSVATVKRRLQRAERCFLERARRRPELEDWLKGSARWQNR